MNPFNVNSFLNAVALAQRVHGVCVDPPVQRAALDAAADVGRAAGSVGRLGGEVYSSWIRQGQGPVFARPRF